MRLLPTLLLARSAIAGLLLVSGTVHASGCPAHYLDGRAPEIRNQKLGTATRELCYGAFVVMHSGITRTALWSAEHLRASNLEQALAVERDRRFHAEQRLPRSERSELRDYARSGFIRGHLASYLGMPDRRTRGESFSLANIVPQPYEHHRDIWMPVVDAVRLMAAKEGELYVITGPAFLGASLGKIGNVIVPSHLYKVVYSPRQKRAAAWLTENRVGAPLQVIPVAELERIVGIDLMPSLASKTKERVLHLPRLRQQTATR